MPKVDEIDFKTGESVAVEGGQVEETELKETPVAEQVAETEKEETQEVAETEPEESVESLKERLKKVEEEKENYKKGMLKAKGKTLETESKKEEEAEEDYPEWDENSKKFQEQTLSQAKKIAEEHSKTIIEKANEKSAIISFISKHPELGEDDKWNEVISNYNPKNGKETVSDVEKDLERAYVLTRFERGELSQLEAETFKKGEQKGKAEAQISDLASVSKTTSKTIKGEPNVSQGAIQLAQKMRVDTKKLAEEDDSLTAEIQL